MTDFLDLSKQAYDSSTSYVDGNYRKDWDYSLKAFNNEHASGSKYLSDEYKARSRIFHPKTRSIIRKNEAAGAMALFSNMETVDVTAGNPDDVYSVANAACIKELLEYRLSKTIPAFPVFIGGLQDAQNVGAVCSYQYWEYQVKNGKKIKDKPCITLRPIENIRLDAAADWLDPVNSSPFFCDIIPMYVCHVRSMMDSTDDKTGSPKWKKLEDSVILKARPDVMDSTRKARLGLREDPQDKEQSIKAFDIVWVLRWFMQDALGDDYHYYSLGTEDLLTDPVPIEQAYFHGKRPYVIGCSILETHKAIKTSVPVLIRPLQQGINTVGNQRFDNVQFVLNKRWLVARGRQTDVASLVRNVPGGVTMTSNPREDVQESNWPDVTSSSYVEHDRFNSELDDLAGNFSPSTRVANNAVNDTLGGSKMAGQSAGIMTDYLLRTVIETWWEPVLRQLVLLEQHYETDDVVLGVCASKAKLFQRVGMSQITDQLLMNEVSVNVNVGMGASNPGERFQKFIVATKAYTEMVATAPPGFNVIEGGKEIFANAGYRDGSRFVNAQADPRLLKAMEMVKQLGAALQGKQGELQAQAQVEQMKLLSSAQQQDKQLGVDHQRIQGDLAIRQAELAIEAQRVELEKLKLQIELRGSDQQLQMDAVRMQHEIDAAQLKLQGEREKQHAQQIQNQQDIEKSSIELERTRAEMANEHRIGQVAEQVSGGLQGFAKEMEVIKSSIGAAHQGVSSDVADLRKGLGALAGVVMQPQRRAKGLKLKKPDGKKTTAVLVDYGDGMPEEIPINRGA